MRRRSFLAAAGAALTVAVSVPDALTVQPRSASKSSANTVVVGAGGADAVHTAWAIASALRSSAVSLMLFVVSQDRW